MELTSLIYSSLNFSEFSMNAAVCRDENRVYFVDLLILISFCFWLNLKFVLLDLVFVLLARLTAVVKIEVIYGDF